MLDMAFGAPQSSVPVGEESETAPPTQIFTSQSDLNRL
jgi:hypothetical protein